jgi:predicted dehydrogenase/threonine dehydrogenase-like Zn-dependent dehydrogenase
MKQVVQNYRTGELAVEEVPIPALRAGGLLVHTMCSAVSAGTERSKVDLARKGLLGKAMSRPDQVLKVLETFRREGLAATYHKVLNKLDALSPLGYSTAGRVIAVGDGCEAFAVGDRVACAGAGYANHAEVVWAPVNLCARIPDAVDLAEASFATIGAIALHGVRQAEASLGETIAVIGLGLLGQLTIQLLKASGCRVIGIDVEPWKVELAARSGVDVARHRSDDVVGCARTLTSGRGADAVIITAAASSNDPFVLAGELARDRAHIVLVGAVPIEVPRSPYYEKELDVRLSRSYGPGRYDPRYEEKGIDYPAGYVRWTENRNMDAFLQAIAAKQIEVRGLITHRFSLAEAERAYDLVAGSTAEPFLGIVLTYPEERLASGARTGAAAVTPGPAAQRGRAHVGFIGAGSFAGGTLIPILKTLSGVSLAKVCTASGLTARDAAIRHQFAHAVSDPDEILTDQSVNVVVVATRHSSHAALAARALEHGKVVFVEKPLALTREELDRVMAAAGDNPTLMVGFNRRFSPYIERVRNALAGRAGGLVISIRVNAGPIPDESWIHDPEVGGGRLIGEGCHFVDLAHFLVGCPPCRVRASALGSADPASRLRDNISIAIEFTDGSLATIVYTSKGDVTSGKERIEAFGGGISAVIDDFQSATITRRGRAKRHHGRQDKGHREQLKRFIAMACSGAPPPISLEELRLSSLATIAALESIAIDAAVEI